MKKTLAAVVCVALGAGAVLLQAQGGGGQAPGGGAGRAGGAPGGGRGGPALQVPLPTTPTAVPLPKLGPEVTGPGPFFNSASSLAPGKGLDAFKYVTNEYMVSGTADGQPYTTRVVVRKPADNSRFTGLVLAEAMHGSGSAHMFEFTSIYLMNSGHTAVEILTTPPAQFTQLNAERYKEMRLTGSQTNDILAQVGALVRTGGVPVGGPVRKMVLGGTSMTAGVVLNYLPAHRVYRTPKMERIYDGFLPMSNGALVPEVDVPVIHVPTMHEIEGNITNRQDGDEAGKQYRLYEFAGMGHIDTRDSDRLKPNPCSLPLSTYPVQAYMSVALHHLFNWVDKGIAPPRAERTLLDRNTHNDGSMLALDQHGNPRGGIPTTYVDVPVVAYKVRPPATTPVISPASEYVTRGGQQAANIMCNLSTSQAAFPAAKLKELYKNKQAYVRAVEKRLTELEKAGWSLPVYRELILADAAKVSF